LLENAGVDEHRYELEQRGFAWVRGGVLGPDQALGLARELMPTPLEVIGDFILPPPDGLQSRDFQTLHLDFGLPVDPRAEQDVGLYTALHIPRTFGSVSAVTRLVPLVALLAQRTWPVPDELLARLRTYGNTHGAWDDERGYVEGSLARLVEAAAGSGMLPSVKAEPEFLCGMEFDSLQAEHRFFEGHGLDIGAVQIEIPLAPGELLVFDNLAFGHGRRGIRRPGELRQWVFGDPALGLVGQFQVRERVLAAFHGGVATKPVEVSIP
jgi:hypothetical protein